MSSMSIRKIGVMRVSACITLITLMLQIANITCIRWRVQLTAHQIGVGRTKRHYDTIQSRHNLLNY